MPVTDYKCPFRLGDELTWQRLLGLDGSLVFLERVVWVISLDTLFTIMFGKVLLPSCFVSLIFLFLVFINCSCIVPLFKRCLLGGIAVVR